MTHKKTKLIGAVVVLAIVVQVASAVFAQTRPPRPRRRRNHPASRDAPLCKPSLTGLGLW